MRKWIVPLCLIILSCISGCKKADIQFGEQFVDANYTNVVAVDTLTPEISTIVRDSVVTSQTGNLLIGGYADPFFGKISSSAFFVLSNPSGIPDFHVSAAYDSIVLQMRGDSTFYGDTSVAQQFSVSRLTSMIELPEGSSYLYNTSNFPAASTPLGTTNVLIRPSQKDSVKIRLSNSWGQELFNFMQEKALQTSSANDFEHYFNGIRIAATGTNAAILGFSDSVTVRLFYHESNPYAEVKTIDLTLTSRNRQFNQIKFDRTGTALNLPLPENKELPSAQTGHAAYIQSLTGVLMKVRFPTLRSLLQRSDFIRLMNAQLIIPPLPGSYDHTYMPPPQLMASSTNINNQLGGSLAVSGATGTQSIQYGDLKVDWIYGENTYYTYDVTGYVAQQLAITGDNTNGLIFLPPSPAYNSNFNRLVVGDPQNGKGKNIQLKIYYISVQTE